MTQDDARQRAVVVVPVVRFVLLQRRNVQQRLPIGGIYIGQPVLGIVCIAVVELVGLTGVITDQVHLAADQVVPVADELEAVVAMGGKQSLPVMVKQMDSTLLATTTLELTPYVIELRKEMDVLKKKVRK